MAYEHKYDDIINLPHHKSAARKHMAVADRAAQFAPFAALTGYDAAVRETARLTENKIELDEYEKEKINNTLLQIQERINDKQLVKITYFIPDDKKSGGKYVTKSCAVKKISSFERTIILDDGTEIPIDTILAIDGTEFLSIDF